MVVLCAGPRPGSPVRHLNLEKLILTYYHLTNAQDKQVFIRSTTMLISQGFIRTITMHISQYVNYWRTNEAKPLLMVDLLEEPPWKL